MLISKENVFLYLFEIFCVGALTPTCTLLKADYWPASVLGPRQLALSVEFLFEILCVGAPGRIFVRLITVNIKLCA
ncbi:hypothetical protein B6175_10090 [Staphylococcus aureus]|nr:hypothetical protein B6175_10090 [Staphylococcus aureus]